MQIVNITSDQDEALAPFRNIKEKDLVGRKHKFIAEGRVVLSVLLASDRFTAESIVITENRLANMLPLLQKMQPQCPIYCVPQTIMDTVAGFSMHRGILAVGSRREQSDLDSFLNEIVQQNSKKPSADPLSATNNSYDKTAEQYSSQVISEKSTQKQRQLLIVLNKISNHDNIGSVFRNVAAFAADGVILDKFCCDPLYRKAIRVSVGAALKIPFVQAGTIEEIATKLHAEGWQVIALSGDADINITSVAKSDKIALLLGSEGEGLPPEILTQHEAVRIPIAADFDSLNIATACGIALSHFADTSRLR